ncbi:sodium:proton antiporter [Paenibacillus swuensis]|uniref:Sodium:proton antiporter n=1 Tax=Paenibacillus swuensis TaxID=1178515 RepID=A0A172TLM2_9BACL|nr:Na+/H+ antiporter NhaC [Paenibacillus swuensis]ANE47717.1 sodium:proton antiporter [Paenibacillus swuensis]
MNETSSEEPGFRQSLIILGCLVGWLIYSIFVMKSEPHIPLLTATVITALLLKWFGVRWNRIEHGMIEGIRNALQPILILCLIGILIGTWMMSGTVPTLLYVGMEWLDARYFAFSALGITVLVSLFTGSSFTTISTVGVALMGIGTAIGADPYVAAGAIVSGACFGDKMSPLSDTTNFAPAVAGTDLYTHIRNMMYTSGPAMIITVFIFLWSGTKEDMPMEQLKSVQTSLSQNFHLHWLTLTPLLVVLMGSMRRYPILPTLTAGIASGLVVTAVTQGNSNPSVWFQVMQQGYKADFTNEIVASIVNRGGLQSMMWSVSLILIALALGGILQHGGVITALFRRWVRPIQSNGAMVWAAGTSSIGVNLLTGEQYLSILLPGQMFREEFKHRLIPAKTLSRTLEDCGTLVNALVPWGVSGAFFANALHVPVTAYMPYAFFLWLSPILTFMYATLPYLREKTLYEHKMKM